MWWSCWAFLNIDANLRLYCKWFLHPFEHCLRPKLIAKEASLKSCHENQGSVSGCGRRAVPPLRLQGCSTFSRTGICPAPCTRLSIISLIRGFLSLLSSILGKQHQLHATSSLFPDDEEIFLLSRNHSYSRLPVNCNWYCHRKKLTNCVTARHSHCQTPTCMWANFDPSFEPEFLSLSHLQRLWCAGWVRAAQPVPIPIPTLIVATGLWALECWWLLLAFASFDNPYALHQCISWSNNKRCCFLPLSTCPRSALCLHLLPRSTSLCIFIPEGRLP